MTFWYQRQCEDPCYSSWSCGTVGSSRSCDWSSPWSSQGWSGRFCGYRDCWPSSSSRCWWPYSSRYSQRCSWGSSDPCYQC